MTPPDRDEHGRSGGCTCGAYWDGDLSLPHSVGCPMDVDPTPARTVGENGVALCRSHIVNHWFGTSHTPQHETTHVAFPKDEAEALLKVARMARDPLRTDGLLTLALMELDAARKQGGS